MHCICVFFLVVQGNFFSLFNFKIFKLEFYKEENHYHLSMIYFFFVIFALLLFRLKLTLIQKSFLVRIKLFCDNEFNESNLVNSGNNSRNCMDNYRSCFSQQLS